MPGRTLLVLGGTGFFGKSILDAFRRGLLASWNIDRVIAAARDPAVLSEAHPDLVGDGVELLALDVTIASALPAADILIHAANTTDARRYMIDPLGERQAILAAADRFATLAVAANRCAQIVYCSSGAVYGRQPTDLPGLTEDHELSAADELIAYKRDYAEAKRLAEATVARLGDVGGMRVAVARCFAFVGAYLPQDQHFAVGNFIADGIAGRPVTVNATRPVVRSYLYADDLVEWLMTIAAVADPVCPVFNVGSDEAVEMRQLAGHVSELWQVPIAAPPLSDGETDRYVPAVDRARSRLGLTVRHDLRSALIATKARLAAIAASANDARVDAGPVKS